MWPWAYNRHTSQKNIDKLRKLIQAGFTKELAHTCNARIIPARLFKIPAGLIVGRRHIHRTELVTNDLIVIKPPTLLFE